MTKDEILARADNTFDRVLATPGDPNANVIVGRKDNSAEFFKPEKMIERADRYAEQRAREGMDAVASIRPSTDGLTRFSK